MPSHWVVIVESFFVVFAAAMTIWFAFARSRSRQHHSLVKWRATVESELPNVRADLTKLIQETSDFRLEVRKEIQGLKEDNHREHVHVRERLASLEAIFSHRGNKS